MKMWQFKADEKWKSHEKAATANQVHNQWIFAQIIAHSNARLFRIFILFYCYYVTNSNMKRLLPATDSNEMKVMHKVMPLNLNIIECGQNANEKEEEEKKTIFQ